jgi:hypothetical protein
MKKKVINWKQLPIRSPVPNTLLWVTALHYWSAPGWLWGVIGVFVVLHWVLAFVEGFTAEKVDVFKS